MFKKLSIKTKLNVTSPSYYTSRQKDYTDLKGVAVKHNHMKTHCVKHN